MNDPNPAANDSAQGPGPSPTAPSAADAVAAAEAKAQANWDSYVRALAELENFRKRSERELENARKYGIERFAQDLLPVRDALEAGIQSAGASPGAALLEGAQATLRELERAFEKAGIKLIDPVGQPFDPSWHEAMLAQERADQPPGTVLSVIQKGYSLNGRLLRPARVVVSREPGAH